MARRLFEEQIVESELFKRTRASELRDAFVTPGLRAPAIDAARKAIRHHREAQARAARAQAEREARRLSEEAAKQKRILRRRIVSKSMGSNVPATASMHAPLQSQQQQWTIGYKSVNEENYFSTGNQHVQSGC